MLYFVGVLAYFQAQLADIMAYADLQPKVFQYFREIGNAIIFALHFEHAMVLITCVFNRIKNVPYYYYFTTILWPLVRDYPREPVPEETPIHSHPS